MKDDLLLDEDLLSSPDSTKPESTLPEQNNSEAEAKSALTPLTNFSSNVAEPLNNITQKAFMDVQNTPIQNIDDIKDKIDVAVQLSATAEAINPSNEDNKEFLEDLKKQRQQIIKGSAKTDKYRQDAKKTLAKQTRNEAFYKAFRPILEFDFSNITGIARKDEKDYNDRSYGLSMMILMLAIFTPFYIVIAITLMLCKSIDVIGTYILSFSKTTSRICGWAFVVGLVVLTGYVIVTWLESRFGLSIIHPEKVVELLNNFRSSF